MFYVFQPETIEFCHVIVIERIENLPSIFSTADKTQLTQAAQLVRYSRLCHFQLRCELTDISLAVKQNRNNAQTSRVAQGTEQVSQVGGGIFFEDHDKYMNNC